MLASLKRMECSSTALERSIIAIKSEEAADYFDRNLGLQAHYFDYHSHYQK